MKLIALAITLLLLANVYTNARLNPTNPNRPAQQTPSDLQALEEQFRQLDEKAGQKQVIVNAKNDSLGYLVVNGEAKNLLILNLSTLTIPDAYIERKIFETFTKTSDVGAIPGIKVRQFGASKHYEVVEDYTYNAGAYRITVPKGFIYDRASIPRVFWLLVDKDSLSNVAPVFHDLLYRNGGALPQTSVSPYRKFSRKDTDDLFLELMTKCGVTEWRRRAAYEAVRKGGAFAWKGD